ncbi:cysteine desulfurase family protein [Clostridium cellulovorans]|uniref:Cysteine desulfurase n=1 Tax=Clostridium cellulovorans (strain ATCC 35296 / DSM 3052 / OCM 3 / 743B) TaxID=573061 RepID=D9SQI6_CLOC7|nr:cysteine desulfurase family protein [Clostridium cellulovorans]ADL52192.1 Cysteine desulfurase [Clostridium cellulovorans 743B]
MKKDIYLDNAATTKPFEEVAKKQYEVMLNYFGNPSSVHKLGVESFKVLKKSREVIAKTLNAGSDEIIFTSGATESNNFIIRGFIGENSKVITTEIEHPSVISTFKLLEEEGVTVVYLKCNKDGEISLEELEKEIDKNTVLVSMAHVNNVIGAVQPIEEIGNIIKAKSSRAKFHVDAAQSYGKYKIDVKKLKVDLITASAHKFHGPKGIGFTYLRKGLVPKQLILGGGQENGFRSGTENLPAIAAMAEAAEITYKKYEAVFEKVREIKTYFAQQLMQIDGVNINNGDMKFSPFILNVSFQGLKGEVILHSLEEKGIYVSMDSACSSKKRKKSVLEFLGRTAKEAEGSIRFSFDESVTREDIDYTIAAIKDTLKFLRRILR